MSDVIHLLPDTVANQIAAGEVIQRPASVIKELVENSIDAGATSIKIIIKDAGRTLIQVIDDGKGMSVTDARLCFDRHATSKISSADDLFALHTMGFRGEALPSISSIAQVELKTKRREDEVGTLVEVNGGKIERQESVACQDGTIFTIKNIFYNVPARRKFLKSNSTEFGHIEREFFRIALVNPEVEMELYHNDQLCYCLRAGGLRERIVGVYGKNINSQLLNVKVDSTIVNICGYVGKPETAKKQNEHQYFFVNGRYMRHPYFHKAVMQAYERLVLPGTTPDYFIYFNIDPANIDVNIHPTKTEIKFENEQTIWPILQAGVKEALGKFNVIPSIDFDQEVDVYATAFCDVNNGNAPYEAPKVALDPNYNPFNTGSSSGSSYSGGASYRKEHTDNWESLYEGFENDRSTVFAAGFSKESTYNPFEEEPVVETSEMTFEGEENKHHYLQLKSKYILTITKSGLVCIDQHRAHVRILYDRYRGNMQRQMGASQKLLFPIMVKVTEYESMLLDEMSEELSFVGFDLSNLGGGTFSINGIPSDCKESSANDYLLGLLQSVKEGNDVQEARTEKIVLRLAETSAIPSGKSLTEGEMMDLVSQLFSTSQPEVTPDSKTIISIISLDEMEKRFK